MSTTGPADIAQVFVELADTMVDDFDLMKFLGMLTDRAMALSGTDSAAVLLGDQRDRLQLMVASDEKVHRLEVFQL